MKLLICEEVPCHTCIYACAQKTNSFSNMIRDGHKSARTLSWRLTEYWKYTTSPVNIKPTPVTASTGKKSKWSTRSHLKAEERFRRPFTTEVGLGSPNNHLKSWPKFHTQVTWFVMKPQQGRGPEIRRVRENNLELGVFHDRNVMHFNVSRRPRSDSVQTFLIHINPFQLLRHPVFCKYLPFFMSLAKFLEKRKVCKYVAQKCTIMYSITSTTVNLTYSMLLLVPYYLETQL